MELVKKYLMKIQRDVLSNVDVDILRSLERVEPISRYEHMQLRARCFDLLKMIDDIQKEFEKVSSEFVGTIANEENTQKIMSRMQSIAEFWTQKSNREINIRVDLSEPSIGSSQLEVVVSYREGSRGSRGVSADRIFMEEHEFDDAGVTI